ncbi:DUF1275 domain-containing protein [bacterium]|jgi:uncharacterized membrane protein YoaK (UPF0700 family)|nr:DUF1275 domain-containing protein [bacterium]
MLYGNESISQYSKTNFTIWMVMAFQAGVINIGGFMACHRFVSHVTGFSTFFGMEVVERRYAHAMGMLLVPLFFLGGTMLSGQLVDIRLKLRLKPKYYISFGVIFFFIFSVWIAGVSGFWGQFDQALSHTKGYLLLATLCLVCGIQNGTITAASRAAAVRTTHLTGVTTDLGLGIVRLLNRRALKGQVRKDEARRSLLLLGIILSFGSGSVVGGYVFSLYGYWGFAVPALTSGVLFAAMIAFHQRSAKA